MLHTSACNGLEEMKVEAAMREVPHVDVSVGALEVHAAHERGEIPAATAKVGYDRERGSLWHTCGGEHGSGKVSAMVRHGKVGAYKLIAVLSDEVSVFKDGSEAV